MQLLRDNLTLWTSDMQVRRGWVGLQAWLQWRVGLQGMAAGRVNLQALAQGVGEIRARLPRLPWSCPKLLQLPAKASLTCSAPHLPSPPAQDAEQGREAGGEGEMKDQE